MVRTTCLPARMHTRIHRWGLATSLLACNLSARHPGGGDFKGTVTLVSVGDLGGFVG
jgi:hypothetical protein